MMKNFIQKFRDFANVEAHDSRPKRSTRQVQKSQGATGIISLRDSHLKILPERLQQPATARVIDVTGNKLSKLPAWIGAFGQTLTRLILSSNLLVYLPSEINHLKLLKTLVLDNNRLAALPAHMDLPSLELLDVSHNKLETITAGISRLTNLRELRASHNHLGVLPLQLGCCCALQLADFADNALLALPSELSKLQKLRNLNLDHNSISAVPPSVLVGCTSLQSFTLHGCPITIKELEATHGYAEFEQRRRQKFDKNIASRAMLPLGGFKETTSRF